MRKRDMKRIQNLVIGFRSEKYTAFFYKNIKYMQENIHKIKSMKDDCYICKKT